MDTQFSLRKVLIKDEKLILSWANDPVVRKGSFNHSVITENEHHNWFINKLEDENVLMWIFEVNQKPSGLVRFEKSSKEKAVISYQIAKSSRGKKLASVMLKLSIKELKKFWGDIKILAFTLPKNLASVKSLEKAGFKIISKLKNQISLEYKNQAI